MKKIITLFKVTLLSLTCLFFTTSCDLEVQKPFDFKPETTTQRTFKDQNAWQFIQKQTSPDPTALAGDKLDYFIQAIKLTGLESEYTKTGTNRTFLMLNNTAFTGSGRIIQLVTGSTSGDLVSADKEQLKTLLRYHIVEAYIDQVEALPVFNTYYTFQSLIPGEDGVLSFRRSERYGITVNDSPELPATKRSAGVRNHNFIFQNGIGHVLQSYVRRTPF